MNNRETIVRIVTASDKPQTRSKESLPLPKHNNKNPFQMFLNGLGIIVISVLGIFIVIGFFKAGISLQEIMVLVGIPITVGIFTRYTVF
jgi:hypothetical protein